MLEIKRYEFVLEAETPIAHHEETFGNSAMAMRQRIRLPQGGWQRIPIVTADTMRHGLRETISYVLLDAAGMLNDPSLTESALRLLFAGGQLSGKGDANTVKLDEYRKLVELIPPLALLGGAASNRIIPGRMEVENAILICEETRHLTPAWALDWISRERGGSLDSHRDHIEEVQRVRMDPMLSPEKRELLSVPALAASTEKLAKSEKAHEDDDAAAADDSKSSMMPRRFETVAAGSLFFWRLDARVTSELQLDTLDTMVCAFLARCRVGGKRGVGCGRLSPLVANQIPVMRPRDQGASMDVAALGLAKGEAFRKHVAARSGELRELLQRVDA